MDRKVLREVGRETGIAILAATRKDQLAAELPSLATASSPTSCCRASPAKPFSTPNDGRVTAAKLLGWSTTALAELHAALVQLSPGPRRLRQRRRFPAEPGAVIALRRRCATFVPRRFLLPLALLPAAWFAP